MSWKSFACLAAIAAITAPAIAQPTIELVDNMDDTATLQITTDADDALGTSIRIDFDGLTLTADSLVLGMIGTDGSDPTMILDADGNGIDTNPFENPDGSFNFDQVGLSDDGSSVFAALGLDAQGVRTFDLFTFGYTGEGTINASGLIGTFPSGGGVSQNFSVSDSLVISIGADPFPGDANGDGVVDISDLGILGENFGLDPATFEQGDFNGDGVVDISDLGILGENFGLSAPGSVSLVAVPEPTSLTILAVFGIAAASARRN